MTHGPPASSVSIISAGPLAVLDEGTQSVSATGCAHWGCDEESSGRFGRVSSLGSHSGVASWAAEEATCVHKLCKFVALLGASS